MEPGETRAQETLPTLTIRLPLGWATGKDNGTCDLGCGGEDTAIKEFSLQMCPGDLGWSREWKDSADPHAEQDRHAVQGE